MRLRVMSYVLTDVVVGPNVISQPPNDISIPPMICQFNFTV